MPQPTFILTAILFVHPMCIDELVAQKSDEPTSNSASSLVSNGDFESGKGTQADAWQTAASQFPVRTDAEAHGGSFSLHSRLLNEGGRPSEGLLNQAMIGTVVGGQTYEFSFWVKQVSSGVSYVQQYDLQWLDRSGKGVGGKGLTNFSGTKGKWKKISAPGLIAPVDAEGAKIVFRFVTGAVSSGSGEVFIDDISLGSAGGLVVAKSSGLVKTKQPAKQPVKQPVKQPAKQPVKLTGKGPRGLKGLPPKKTLSPNPFRTPSNSISKTTGELKEKDKLSWNRIKAVLDTGVTQADRSTLRETQQEIYTLMRKRISLPELNSAAELVNIYLKKSDEEMTTRAATRWLERYPESPWSRDILLASIEGSVDQAKFSSAVEMIAIFVKRYPEAPECKRLLLIEKRLKQFVETAKIRGVEF